MKTKRPPEILAFLLIFDISFRENQTFKKSNFLEWKILPPSRDISPHFYFKRLLAEILAIKNLANFSSFSEDFRHLQPSFIHAI
jgi:hypothetical protein